MSQELFGQKTTDDQQTANTDNGLNDLLASIKNEQGQPKYRTVEEALKGLQHAQSYIPEVKNELNQYKSRLSELEAQAQRTQELENIVAELTKKKEVVAEVKPTTQTIDTDFISNSVKSQLEALRQEERESVNRTEVRNAIVARFGEEKAGELFSHKAAELGVSTERLTQLASESPKAVLAMLGVTGADAHKQSKFAPNSSAIRTEGVPVRTESLIGNRDAFRLPVGHTNSDVSAMKQRSDQLLDELTEQGISIADLTNPANYFKIFKN